MLVYPVLAAQHAGAERVIVITGPDDDFADILPEGASPRPSTKPTAPATQSRPPKPRSATRST